MSRADFFTLERKKSTIYSDFSNSFTTNPTTGYLAIKTNEEAVKQSLKNLILTSTGERFYDMNKGSKVRRSLFMTFDPSELELTRLQMVQLIERYEPRANPFQISLFDDLDEKNSIRIRIEFQIINITSPPIELNIFIEKIR